MTATAVPVQQVPISPGDSAPLGTPNVTGAALLLEPRRLLHHEAQHAPDPALRWAAQTLSTVAGLVPCRLAIFWSITPRMEIGDGVLLEGTSHQPATPIDLDFYRPPLPSVDPFAPQRATRLRASLLTVDDAGGAQRFASSTYGRHLRRAGFEHQLCLYLRDAGAIRGTIALLRQPGAPAFDRGEIRMLRPLHPLLESGYTLSLRAPGATQLAPTLPALTRRELEVAALLASGASNAEIATALNIEQATVKAHLNQIYAKFGLRSRTQLALRLNRAGLSAGQSS